MYALWQLLLQPLLNSRMSVRGLELLPSKPFILASNHVDWLDGLLLSTVIWPKVHRKIAFLARANNWWIFAQSTVVIGNDPERALTQLAQRLKQGECAGFFVEGKRNPAGTLKEGKTGAVRFALATGTPIIPVGIRSRSGRNALDSVKKFFQQPPEIRFGNPISYTAYANQTADKQLLLTLTHDLMKNISTLSGKSYPYALG